MFEIKFHMIRELTADEAMQLYPVAKKARVSVANNGKTWVVSGKSWKNLFKFALAIGAIGWLPAIDRVEEIK